MLLKSLHLRNIGKDILVLPIPQKWRLVPRGYWQSSKSAVCKKHAQQSVQRMRYAVRKKAVMSLPSCSIAKVMRLSRAPLTQTVSPLWAKE